MVAGEVQVAFFNMASLLPHIRSGRLKALAAVPPQRLPELPNVPTLAEQGFPGIGTNAWQGLFAPAATPKAVVDRLHAAVVQVLTREKVGPFGTLYYPCHDWVDAKLARRSMQLMAEQVMPRLNAALKA